MERQARQWNDTHAMISAWLLTFLLRRSLDAPRLSSCRRSVVPWTCAVSTSRTVASLTLVFPPTGRLGFYMRGRAERDVLARVNQFHREEHYERDNESQFQERNKSPHSRS